MGATLPKISIVVPTYNRLSQLRTWVESLSALDYPSDLLEIIFVDDGSTDGTREFLTYYMKQYSSVKILFQQNHGPAVARNLGIANSTGDFIAFTDDDCVVTPNWLLCATETLQRGSIAAVGGRVRAAGNNILARYMEYVHALDPDLLVSGTPRYLNTANVCFRRSDLIRAGSFDEKFKLAGGEDTELSFRMRQMGMLLEYDPHMIVYHAYGASADDLLRRYYRYGLGNRQMFDKHLTWEAWLPNAKMELWNLLNCNSEPRQFNILVNDGDRPWFCILRVLDRMMLLAGFLRVTSGKEYYRQLLRENTQLDGFIRTSEFIENSIATKTKWILAGLTAGRVPKIINQGDNQLDAQLWLKSCLQRAHETGDMRSWVKNILQALDFDFLIHVAISPQNPRELEGLTDFQLSPETQATMESQVRAHYMAFNKANVGILVKLTKQPEYNNLVGIEMLCDEHRIGLSRFLNCYEALLSGQPWILRLCSEDERRTIEPALPALRAQWLSAK